MVAVKEQIEEEPTCLLYDQTYSFENNFNRREEKKKNINNFCCDLYRQNEILGNDKLGEFVRIS